MTKLQLTKLPGEDILGNICKIHILYFCYKKCVGSEQTLVQDKFPLYVNSYKAFLGDLVISRYMYGSK